MTNAARTQRQGIATRLASNAGYLGSLRPFSRRTIAQRLLRRTLLRIRRLPGLSTVLAGPGRDVAVDGEEPLCPVVDAAWASERFAQLGIETECYRVNPEAFADFLAKARFPTWYYGGGPAAGTMFVEKTLEHYVSSELLQLGPSDSYIDVGADNSPFAQVAQRLFGCTSYQLDAAYRAGVHGPYIGSDVGSVPLPDKSVTKLAAHCSFDHFQGDGDRAFLKEAVRLLRPGGKLCIVPLYVARNHTNFVDRHSWLSPPTLDPDAQLIDVPGWGYDYSRSYSPETLLDLASQEAPALTLRVYQVQGVEEVNAWCYLRMAAVFERNV